MTYRHAFEVLTELDVLEQRGAAPGVACWWVVARAPRRKRDLADFVHAIKTLGAYSVETTGPYGSRKVDWRASVAGEPPWFRLVEEDD